MKKRLSALLVLMLLFSFTAYAIVVDVDSHEGEYENPYSFEWYIDSSETDLAALEAQIIQQIEEMHDLGISPASTDGSEMHDYEIDMTIEIQSMSSHIHIQGNYLGNFNICRARLTNGYCQMDVYKVYDCFGCEDYILVFQSSGTYWCPDHS